VKQRLFQRSVIGLDERQQFRCEVVDLLIKLHRAVMRSATVAFTYVGTVVSFVNTSFFVERRQHAEHASCALEFVRLTEATGVRLQCAWSTPRSRHTAYVRSVDGVELHRRFQAARIDAESETGAGEIFARS
jgi:hypothetical protein